MSDDPVAVICVSSLGVAQADLVDASYFELLAKT